MNNNEEQYYHDINRIANALEKLVQILPLSEEQNEEIIKKIMDKPTYIHAAANPYIEYICPHCCSKNIHSMYGTINSNGSNQTIHYICENCHKEFDINGRIQMEYMIY